MLAWFKRAMIGMAGALLMFGIAVPPASAAIPAPPDEWFKLPGLNAASGAQWVRSLAYGTPPNVVYAGLEGGGVFRSTNGGATWSAFNNGFPNPLTTNTRALLTSGTGTTVYAGNDSGVWKSTGGAWQPIAQGSEEDPAKPKKLNGSVQSLVSIAGGPMLAGVFSAGVYRSDDDGATWTPPPVNNGMPSSETIYGLTSTVPGTVYATGGSGVYLSVDGGSTWKRISDGIPSVASPITTWAYPQRPSTLFTSTGSNGIYRSLNAGLTWTPINDGLGAVRARGFQVFPGSSTQGAHLYAATEDGLWEALSAGSAAPPPPKWHKVTQDGLIEPGASNTIMWSLTAPAIPGAGSLGLIAGTQSNGGYFLSFSPPDSPCPTTPNTTTDCPRINDTTPVVGQKLTALNGKWTGTKVIDYAYQWEQCSGTSCTPIDGAEESTFVVPKTATDPTPNLGYRVRVTATNPAPTFGLTRRFSTITSPTAANPDQYPGSTQLSVPSISVLSPGETTDPQVGDKMYAEYGLTPSGTTDGWFNPKATTSIAFRWLRCDGSGDDCKEIPGALAAARTYTLTPEDGTHELRVRVTGTNPSGVAEATSGASYDVTSEAAQVAPPLPPETPGGTTRSQAPSISGTAYVGETLAGSVGGWKDPTTDFLRRWVRCEPNGDPPCTIINKVATVSPETGSTYVLRDSDRGYSVRFRVTADVNADLTPDGTDNHLPHAVEVDTAATAVVTDRPLPTPVPSPTPLPGGGGGSGTGGGAGTGGGSGSGAPADAVAPTLASLRLDKTKIVPGKSVPFKLAVSEPGTLRLVITKPASGRKTAGVCKPLTKKNRTKKRCTYQRTVATITQAAASGQVVIPFNGKVGKKKLAAGTYTATIVVTDAAGNTSKATSIRFKIVRK